MTNTILYNFVHILEQLDEDFQQRKYVLTVSGGADSMALLALAHQHGLNGIVAHCNFNLRGDESDADEAFVKKWADYYEYDIEFAHFQTKAYAEKNGISIQMAARDLRYEWFELLRKSKSCDYILLAHHRDDLVETMLINLTRGTGIKGMTGMELQNGKRLRPMLKNSRQDILDYIKSESLDYRDDSSNAEIKYLRNHIRHRVIPAFEETTLDFMQRMTDNADRFCENASLLAHFTAFLEQSICSEQENGDIFIDINHEMVNEMALYEILQTYGFHRSQIADLYTSDLSGKQVVTDDFVLVSDRKHWILRKLKSQANEAAFIQQTDREFCGDVHLSMKEVDVSDVFFSDNPNQVYLDIDKLVFPLEIRAWKEGDRFIPLGMKGSQKLSDFFINRKLSVLEKQDVRLVCSEEKIVWVIGYQIDDAYKISNTTRRSLWMEKLDACLPAGRRNN
ncbi:MAG: tRNA lysidine(34) synthetase TilS [Bacteroidota bacterium]|nr:tRNA lysidine(34) synthetase TilS [Bacteroidota bacterium]